MDNPVYIYLVISEVKSVRQESRDRNNKTIYGLIKVLTPVDSWPGDGFATEPKPTAGAALQKAPQAVWSRAHTGSTLTVGTA